MEIHFYCNVDSEGKIINSVSGESIVVEENTFDYHFVLNTWDIINDIENYQVIDNKLVKVVV